MRSPGTTAREEPLCAATGESLGTATKTQCNEKYDQPLNVVQEKLGEGNGNLLQYSCLENSMDRGTWWATIHGIAKSQT